MAAVTICSDFGAQEKKVCHCFHCFPIYLPWSDETGCHDLSVLNVVLSQPFHSPLSPSLRICLPKQGTQVPSPVQENPTCHRAAKFPCYNCWACAPELESGNHWGHVLHYWSPGTWSPCSTRKAATMRRLCWAMKRSPCSPQLENACVWQQRPSTARNK